MTMADLVLNDRCGLEHDLLQRDILGKRSSGTGRRGRDLVHDVHALDHLPEYGISVALGRCIAKIERLVIRDVDEELRGRGLRVAGACPRYRTGHVEEA